MDITVWASPVRNVNTTSYRTDQGAGVVCMVEWKRLFYQLNKPHIFQLVLSSNFRFVDVLLTEDATHIHINPILTTYTQHTRIV